MKRLTLIVVPGDATASRTFRIPRFVPKALLVLALTLLYVAVFFGMDYFDLRRRRSVTVNSRSSMRV